MLVCEAHFVAAVGPGSYGEFLFEDPDTGLLDERRYITYQDFLELVMQLRADKPVSFNDVVELRTRRQLAACVRRCTPPASSYSNGLAQDVV